MSIDLDAVLRGQAEMHARMVAEYGPYGRIIPLWVYLGKDTGV